MTRTILRWIIYVGTAALLFVPLIVSDAMYFPFITGKAFSFRIITEIMFAAWLILATFDESVRPRYSWLLAAVGAFVLVPLGGVFFGVNTGDAIWSNFERMIGWITILHFGLLFVAVSHTLRPKHWRWLFYLSLGISVIVGIVGLAEVGSEPRIDATLGNPIYLAMYSLWHAFLAGFFLVGRIKEAVTENTSLLADWRTYAFTAVGVLNLVVLWYTGTRGAILGLIAGLLVSSLVVAIFQRNRPLVRKVAMAGVILPVLAVGLFLGFRNNPAVEEAPVIGRFAQIDLQEGTAGARLDTWQIGLQGYTDRPVFGWGMGNFNYVFNKHYKPAMFDDAEWFDRAHNVLVEWLVAAGPFGLLAYLSLFTAAVWLIWKRPREGEGWSVSQRAVLLALLTSYLVQNLFVFDHLTSYIMFALFLAWLHARSSEAASLVGQPQMSRRWKFAAGVGIIGLVLAVGITWNKPGINQAYGIIAGLRDNARARQVSQRRPSQANQFRNQALTHFQETISIGAMGTQEAREQLSQNAISVARNTGASSSVAQKYFQSAQANMKEQIAHEPKDLRHHVFYGDLLVAYGEYEQAISEYKTASDMSGNRKQTILFSLANAYRLNDQPDKSLKTLRTAYELPTDFDNTVNRYAAGLIRHDQLDKAEEVLKKHFGTTVVDSQRLIQAYKQNGYLEKTIPILEKRVRKAKSGEVPNPQQAAQAFVSLAAGYERTGSKDKAIETLQTAKKRFPAAATQIDRIMGRIRQGGEVR